MAKIDKKYHQLLHKIITDGFKYEDPNRIGVNRIQIPSFQFKHDFKDGFPAITTKKLYWKGVVGELLWFLKGNTNINYLLKNNINIWNKDGYNYKILNDTTGYYKIACKVNSIEDYIKGCKDFPNHNIGDLGRVYGAQWRNWKINNDYSVLGKMNMATLDQISNLIKGLKETPMGTKHIVTAWNPAELDDMALPPCHWSFEILVEPLSLNTRKKLYNDKGNFMSTGSWGMSEKNIIKEYHEEYDKDNIPKYQFTLKWHQRSVDTFLGLPFNIASYATLAQIIGKLTNMVPKGIIGDLSNVHIYESHMDAVNKQLRNDVNKYGKCELDIKEILGFEQFNKDFDLNTLLNKNLGIKDFTLKGYESYPAIPAEMLAYS